MFQVVRVSIKPAQRERWLDLVHVNAAQTRSEEGCARYLVGEGIDAPNTFVLGEWTSMEAQLAHVRTPEFGELMGSLQEVLAGLPNVSIHDVASTQTLDEAVAAAGVAAP